MSEVPEARIVLDDSGHGHVPEGPGWYVLNAADAAWEGGHFGDYTRLGGTRELFPHVGINIGVLQPGQPACWYHGEDEQEDFLVLQGECLLIVEEQERRLKAWDFVHCPAWTEHVFVGAGTAPATILAIGTRLSDAVIYPAGRTAARHGAASPVRTDDPRVAYDGLPEDRPVPFRPEWLPGYS